MIAFFLASLPFLVMVVMVVKYAVKSMAYKRKKLTPHQEEILNNFEYYQRLSPKQKELFYKKLKYFLFNKRFVSHVDPEIATEAKVLISAHAAQLTFGLRKLRFSHFANVVIYPSTFFNKYIGKYLNGEVNINGEIKISWSSYLKDESAPHNGYNVILHELAHALRVEDLIPNDESNFLKQQHIEVFEKRAKLLSYKIKKGEITFLRKYATANKDEFFAVAIESFFERPHLFREEMPQLYETLVKMLGQDPSRMYKQSA